MAEAETARTATKNHSTYDEVPYQSLPFAQAHPDRMATIAKLFGMNPAPIDNCRILELGSAAGGHIIPIAYSYPNSHVVGIDLSQVQISEGQQMIDALGLKNIELKTMSISDLTPDFGQFDYIICHGVFTWIPENVQEDVLRICQNNLTPNGVAYISYNCYPGWHTRGMVRKMMQYHCEQFPDVQTKVAQARAMLNFLVESVAADNAYSMVLRSELDFLSPQPDSYLYHEFLEDLNKPMYFHDFADWAAKHNLQYLGEVDFFSMLGTNLPESARQTLSTLTTEIVNMEQYMDFVRNQYFRQTLLCKRDVQINRALTAKSLLPFLVSCQITADPSNDYYNSSKPANFGLPNGVQISTSNSISKAALLHLSEIWPKFISIEDLFNVAMERVSNVDTTVKIQSIPEKEKLSLSSDLLNLYTTNLLAVRTCHVPFTTSISERPKVSDVARYLAKIGRPLCNQLHNLVNADLIGLHVINLCDGSRTEEDVLSALVKKVRDGELNIVQGGSAVLNEQSIKEILLPQLKNVLEDLRKNALLIA